VRAHHLVPFGESMLLAASAPLARARARRAVPRVRCVVTASAVPSRRGVRLPFSELGATDSRLHVVKGRGREDDTLAGVCSLYGVLPEELLRANPGLEAEGRYAPGTRLLITAPDAPKHSARRGVGVSGVSGVTLSAGSVGVVVADRTSAALLPAAAALALALALAAAGALVALREGATRWLRRTGQPDTEEQGPPPPPGPWRPPAPRHIPSWRAAGAPPAPRQAGALAVVRSPSAREREELDEPADAPAGLLRRLHSLAAAVALRFLWAADMARRCVALLVVPGAQEEESAPWRAAEAMRRPAGGNAEAPRAWERPGGSSGRRRPSRGVAGGAQQRSRATAKPTTFSKD
jgi:phage tail protein X